MSASLNPGITSNTLNEICQRNKSDVPKTLSNICDGTFGDNSLQFSAVNYFHKKLHHRCLTGKKKPNHQGQHPNGAYSVGLELTLANDCTPTGNHWFQSSSHQRLN